MVNYRNVPKEVVVSYKMIMTPEQKDKIDDMIVDLLVNKIRELSRKNTIKP